MVTFFFQLLYLILMVTLPYSHLFVFVIQILNIMAQKKLFSPYMPHLQ